MVKISNGDSDNWHLLMTGVGPDDFAFQFVRHTLTSYIGMAVKRE
jgi:hypothetical protein